MPLFVGDVNVQRFVNDLERRIEVLEAVVSNMPKSSAVEKMVEAKVEAKVENVVSGNMSVDPQKSSK